MSDVLRDLRERRRLLVEGEDTLVQSLDLAREQVEGTRSTLLRVGAHPTALDHFLDLYAAEVRAVAAAEQVLLSRGDQTRAIDRLIALLETDAGPEPGS